MGERRKKLFENFYFSASCGGKFYCGNGEINWEVIKFVIGGDWQVILFIKIFVQLIFWLELSRVQRSDNNGG